MKTDTKRKSLKNLEFNAGDYVVYPTHGVGQVTGVEEREIAGQDLQLFIINFDIS